MKRNVRWHKGVEESYQVRVYKSHCGRFLIRRRVYELPIKSVGYALEVDGRPAPSWARESDTLQAAKDRAELFVDPNWEPDT